MQAVAYSENVVDLLALEDVVAVALVVVAAAGSSVAAAAYSVLSYD